ncbi:glutathione synthetase ATP-binding domain-like protein [Linnemannia elongata AG-77]|uniref:Glutathione synthetase ATP-binding domain-like protein n=1 Tax=Linnemannia elongata AG-77 TaxID=1314771 RepID=A0A197KJT5_9FUNG|nr:glutathione synthetase ATP-binding domain-like protein [Linnemannia elongata AG-77]
MTPSKSAESHTATAPAGNPTIMWSVHVFASYALVKDIDKDKDDIDGDDSYFITTNDVGEKMATEWNPELRLGIKKAIDTIPHVYRQEWHYMGLDAIDRVIKRIEAKESDHDVHGRPLDLSKFPDLASKNVLIKPVVLNFIDGMETDGWPGITVIKKLESRHIAFTGADSTLYYLDSDKALIKRHLVDSKTPTPGYCDIYSRLDEDMEALKAVEEEDADMTEEGELKKEKSKEELEEDREEEEMTRKAVLFEKLSKLKFPLLVKPANSSSSRGISTKSVVDTPEEAYERAMETKQIWGPVYVEEYITGREYTVLVSGSSATGIKVFKVLERVFRSEIPERERMLTHDMKWGENSYGSDETVKTAQWWMQVCSDADQERLQAIAKSIYASFGGNGYCRMDLREDHRSGDVYVVDVNANCSIDEDEDSAMGKILKGSGLTLGQFFSILMEDAIHVRDNLVAKLKGHAHSELKNLATLAATGGTKRPNAAAAVENGVAHKNIRVSA